jgi:hypothetical protein
MPKGRILIIIGLVFSVIATIFLYLGSKGVPWENQTWNGKSNQEMAFKRKGYRCTIVGFAFLFIGFLCQLIGELF